MGGAHRSIFQVHLIRPQSIIDVVPSIKYFQATLFLVTILGACTAGKRNQIDEIFQEFQTSKILNVQREDYEKKGFDVQEGRNSDKSERQQQWVGRNYSPHFLRTPVKSQAFGGGKNFDGISQKIFLTESRDIQKKEGSERKTWAARGRGGVQLLGSGDLTKEPERLRDTSKYFERKQTDSHKEEIKTKMTNILSKLQLQELDREKGSFRKRLQGARSPIQPSSRSLLAAPSTASRTSRTFSATSTSSPTSTMGSVTNASSPPFQVIHTSPNGRRAQTISPSYSHSMLEMTGM